jgi:hypothetical protein
MFFANCTIIADADAVCQPQSVSCMHICVVQCKLADHTARIQHSVVSDHYHYTLLSQGACDKLRHQLCNVHYTNSERLSSTLLCVGLCLPTHLPCTIVVPARHWHTLFLQFSCVPKEQTVPLSNLSFAGTQKGNPSSCATSVSSTVPRVHTHLLFVLHLL